MSGEILPFEQDLAVEGKQLSAEVLPEAETVLSCARLKSRKAALSDSAV